MCDVVLTRSVSAAGSDGRKWERIESHWIDPARPAGHKAVESLGVALD